MSAPSLPRLRRTDTDVDVERLTRYLHAYGERFGRLPLHLTEYLTKIDPRREGNEVTVWRTSAEVAAILKCDVADVADLIHDGALDGRKRAGRRQITQSSLDVHLARRTLHAERARRAAQARTDRRRPVPAVTVEALVDGDGHARDELDRRAGVLPRAFRADYVITPQANGAGTEPAPLWTIQEVEPW